jgi:NADH dehydrogenase [ubiquinone] 1 alpha subcomplex assembly factor 7
VVPAPAAEVLQQHIRREGPISFADFQRHAIDAFFAAGRGAGRAGRDFVTSPESGTLFGAVVAQALDDTWETLGRPDPFVFVDAGAGQGRLTADVLRSAPTCAPALRCVLIERSTALREAARELLSIEPADEVLGPFFAPQSGDDPPEPIPGTGPLVTALDDLPAVPMVGVVCANELLDNLPVHLVERHAPAWDEVRVGLAPDEETFVHVLVPAAPALARDADEVAGDTPVPDQARLPVPTSVGDWLERSAAILRHGQLWLLDYADEVSGLLTRGPSGPAGWLRTYREHHRGTDPLDAPGTQDITCDVELGSLRRVVRRAGLSVTSESTQADWLNDHGLDALVEAGRRRWSEGAHRGDLAAVAGRSRVVESAALTDPAGLGAHRVIVCSRP